MKGTVDGSMSITIQVFGSGRGGLLRAEVVVIEELNEERVKMNYCMENIPRRKVAWNSNSKECDDGVMTILSSTRSGRLRLAHAVQLSHRIFLYGATAKRGGAHRKAG